MQNDITNCNNLELPLALLFTFLGGKFGLLNGLHLGL
ncbi:hypothetical protein T05_7843 [Trichinella murrelli]|uniref:Uncharacterized protein n=1 Tax=Trichinella murrelli TaxID=144512 RepID=A0A0V0SPT0_9BILA|nr:hypothetical protein T05_7843 [Trichinella murrelli]